MIHVESKMRPLVKRHGGKAYLARRIIALFPPHRTYVEPFLGGGSILLNKPKSEREIAGDLDADLVWLWGCVQGRTCELNYVLRQIPYTEQAWLGWTTDKEVDKDPIDRAAAFLVRSRFSRGGLGKTFAWSDRLRGGQPGDANSWDTIRSEITAIAERIRDVDFVCGNALGLIAATTGPGTLIYCDPPYLHETRTARKAYDHEMTADDHHDLIAALKRAEERGSKVFLSGYRSELYDRCIPPSWTLHTFEMANHSGQSKTKQRRIECVWESR